MRIMSIEDESIQGELEQVEAELVGVELSLQELLERQSVLTKRKSELVNILEQKNLQHKQEKDVKFWNQTDFPWTADIEEKLKSVFGLATLRPMQRQTMNATMSGSDCLLIMPTGGGKSLCFQLPAVISKGLTLVISPLVSLMEDQQMALEQLHVPSAILTASSSKEMQKFVLDDMVKANGSLRLLYVTPEKLAKSKRFMNKLEKCYSVGHLTRLVIDEVHCCSQWGHDFRPDYKFLGIMKRQFPNTPILGLTATATTKVLDDIKKILNIPKALLLKASFNRPNLFYEVREKPSSQKESIDAILSLIHGKFQNQSGIVYCFSRKESEEVALALSERGVKAGCYHADVDPKSRSLVHRKWLNGDIQVVVATVAFGMGIDKADVRFVIHHSISKSMENLYQESGRAGRDGNRSDCIVFYRLADVIRQSSMVFTEQTGLTNLHGIVNYCCDVASCRRSVIASHFGEVWDGSQCAVMCDLCERKENGGGCEKKDITRHCADVLDIMEAAASSEQRVTALKLIDAWYGRGPTSLKVKSVKPPSLSRAVAERIVAHMMVNNFLCEDFHFTAYSTICYLVSGSKAHLIRKKMTKVFLDIPTKTSQSSSHSSSGKKDKPKLVVVNKEKSHFHSWDLSSSISSSSQKLANTPKSSSTVKTTSTSTGSQLKHPSQSVSITDRAKTSIDVSDSDENLNFDDSDDFASQMLVKRSLSISTKQNSLSGKSSSIETNGDNSCKMEDDDADLKRKSKQKCSSTSIDKDSLVEANIGATVLGDSDSDEEICVQGRKRRGRMLSDESSSSNEGTSSKTSRLSLSRNKRKKESIVISDDDESE